MPAAAATIVSHLDRENVMIDRFVTSSGDIRDGFCSSDKIKQEYLRLIRELSEENENLTKRNEKLDDQLKFSHGGVCDNRNEEIDYDKIDSRAKCEYHNQLEHMSHENKHLRIQLEDIIKQKHELEREINNLIAEKERIESKCNETHKQFHFFDVSEKEMRKFLIRAEEDKKRLAQRIQKLTANERTLVLELERLKRHGGTSDGQFTKRISQLDEFISGIESDRDYWRGQVELLQQMINISKPSYSTGNMQAVNTTTTSSRIKSKPPLTQTTSKAINAIRDAKMRKMEQQINELRSERDRLANELGNVMKHQHHSSLTRTRSLGRCHNRTDYLELTKLRQERDDLKNLLNNLEHKVQEIQRNVHSITQERDHLNKLYSEARNEIHHLHQDLHTIQNSGDHTSQTMLRRAEIELERALSDLSRVTAERDNLIVKYKNANENRNSDKLRLTNQLDHLETNLNQVSQERDDMVKRTNFLKTRVEELEIGQQQMEMNNKENNEILKKSTDEISRLRQECSEYQRVIQQRDAHIESMQNRNQKFETELRLVKDRLEACKQNLKVMNDKIKLSDEDKSAMNRELERIISERNEFQKQTRQLDKYMQQNAVEKEKLTKLCNELKESKDNSENQLAQLNVKNQADIELNQKLQERIDSILHERSKLERRLAWSENQLKEIKQNEEQLSKQIANFTDQNQWLQETNDKLQIENNTLRSTVELANKDKLHLESCIEELATGHRQIVRERDDNTQRMASLRERISELENENKQYDVEIKRHCEVLRNEKSSNADLQQQLDLCRRRLEQTEKEMNELSERLRHTEDKLHKSETCIVQMERELRSERDDYLQLRSKMEISEEEKQNLETNFKESVQRLSHAEVDLSSRNREVHDLRAVNEEIMRANIRYQEQISSRTLELNNLKNELSTIQNNLDETCHLLEVEERESKRLREDLNRLSRESKNVITDLQDLTEERDELKQRTKDYLHELSRLERLLSERDNECSKLIEQLRTTNEDVNSWRSRWEITENRLTTCKVELEERELEVSAERDRSDDKERELNHLKSTLNTIELQCNTNSRAVVDANEQLKISKSEIHTLSCELARTRDLLTKYESDKSNSQREIASNRLDNNQLKAQLDDFEIELEQLKEQLEEERQNTKTINELLNISRQKEQKSLQELQEKTGESVALRERMAHIEERHDATQREMERLRERLVDTEREATRLSRSLSVERFEKERALSELRLSSLPVGYKPSGYSSMGGTYYASSSMPRDRI